MSKEYRYRKHIYWGQYAILLFFIPFFLFLLGLSIFLASQSRIGFVAVIPAILGFVFLLEGGVLWYFYYQLAGTSVSINDDELIYKNRNNEKRYPLESIRLEFASIKYAGGWVKIRTDKDTIRLTVVLEDISGFLRDLKTKLDNKKLSGRYDSRLLFGFLKTAVASDQSWERTYTFLGKIILLLFDVGIALFAGFIFGTIPLYGLIFILIWAGFSMGWVIIAITIAEIVLMRRIAKKSDQTTFTFPPRDLPYENLVFNKTFIWGSIAYILISSFVLVLTIGAKFLFQS